MYRLFVPAHSAVPHATAATLIVAGSTHHEQKNSR
jgi:hypothetical protein